MPTSPHELASDTLAAQLRVDLKTGLTQNEAALRTSQLGLNRLEESKPESVWSILLRQVNSVIVWILAGAAIVSFFLGDTVEGFAIIAVIMINATTGFILEFNARQSMEALKKMDTHSARVLREGKIQDISSEEVTEGDVLLVEAGDLIVADANLFEVNQLEVDESALTGESLPSSKNTNPSIADSALGDQHNRLFKGTAVTSGNGKAIVTAIGQKTELGKIATLVQESEQTATPLEAKLNSLGKILIWVTVALAVLFLVVGLIRGEEPKQLIETAVALAIAAIPEGMSVVATIALAYGMLRLAHKKVIVKRLSAVETLGGTNVIFTDKTGTLTQNKMEVHAVRMPKGNFNVRLFQDNSEPTSGSFEIIDGDAGLTSDPDLKLLVKVAALANNAQLQSETHGRKELGDPIEIALLAFAQALGTPLESLHKQYPRKAEKAFTSDTRIMATLHQAENYYFIGAKGATEEILELCEWPKPEERKKQLEISEAMAAEGLRTLAFAYRESQENPEDNFLSEKLTFLGLIGFLDPPRKEVTPALQKCKAAGIKVIMVTGDHPSTSLTIARQVNLVAPEEELVLTGSDLKFDDLTDSLQSQILACQVFARVNPAQKLTIIDFYQQQGNIVGMTGDGVNDAPALKKSDIGIAMGVRGTAVAAEAADMILKDDSFTSIAKAIEQGRVIFENIRKFIVFLLSCNMSEIFVVTFAGFLNVGNPLLPLQILFINIITDVFPALALGVGKENKELMTSPPRNPQQPILVRKDWLRIVLYALVMTGAVLFAYYYGTIHCKMSAAEGNTITFYALSLAQLLHVFNLYSSKRRPFRNEITRNKYVWYALLSCTVILLATYYVPFMRQILSLQLLTLPSLELILLAGVAPLVVIQLARLLKNTLAS